MNSIFIDLSFFVEVTDDVRITRTRMLDKSKSEHIHADVTINCKWGIMAVPWHKGCG